MKHVLILILLFSITNILAQRYSKDISSNRFSLSLKMGTLKESFKVDDQSSKLSRSPIVRIFFGTSAGYHYNNKIRFILDYQSEQLGTSATFANPLDINPTFSTLMYHRISAFYERDVFPVSNKSKLNIFFRIGPSISITSTPNALGVSGFGRIDNVNDSIYFIYDTTKSIKQSFLSIGGAAGLRYNFNTRLSLTGSISRAWNMSSKNITTKSVSYKAHDLTGWHRASIRTTGNIVSYQLSLGYNFGQRKDTAAERRMRAKGVKWPDKKFSLMFNTSNNYVKNYLTDPSGFLTNSPYLRFTFGLQLRYQISDKWYISSGFESFPNGVDPRPASIVAGNGVAINNAYQFPVSVEYKLFSLRKKIKFDVFVKSGMVLGMQFLTNPAESIARPDSSFFVFENPIYYEEIEATSLRKKCFWAVAASLNLNLHLSRSVFLLGCVNQQVALSKTPFIQRDVDYKMSANQLEYYRAKSYSTGTVFQVGFGIGFRF